MKIVQAHISNLLPTNINIVGLYSSVICEADPILQRCALEFVDDLHLHVQKRYKYCFKLEEPAACEKKKLIILCGGTVFNETNVQMSTIQMISYCLCLTLKHLHNMEHKYIRLQID
jgi:hypothetical protein